MKSFLKYMHLTQIWNKISVISVIRAWKIEHKGYWDFFDAVN